MLTLFNMGEFAGVSDLMRYEILAAHGGVDADSVCLEPLDDLLHLNSFAVFENEQIYPDRIANGFLGANAGHPLFAAS
jgi:mannosyltransferase OCH1-like enzyme